MAWYKTGTVNVTNNSTAVTATGSKFATNARVGDGWRGPDGEWYEVTNIASETTLGIYPAYQGTTVVNSPNYMIAPLQGYNKESADRLRAITDSIRDFTADVEAAAASAAAAQESEDAAKASENAAKTSETNAKTSETNAKASELDAAASESAALASKNDAAASESAALVSKNAALVSENNAKTSETNAAASENSALTSKNAAGVSEVNAKTSETNSKASEDAALISENNASASATTATTQAGIATASKDAAEDAQAVAEQARDDAIAAAGTVTGNLMDQGPWDASTGVYPTKPAVSSFWKVTGNGSATDAGETISYGIGDTLVWSKPINNFYKIDNTESVSSVAGKTGVVVLVKNDVGLGNVDNTSDLNKPLSTLAEAAFAIRTPTQTNTDQTPGRLLKVGDFGVGGPIILVSPDLNTVIISGEYYCNNPINSPNSNGWLKVSGLNSDYCTQEFKSVSDGIEYIRSKFNNVWGTWSAVVTTKNFPYKFNYIDNSQFYYWQRGPNLTLPSVNTYNAYTTDRWVTQASCGTGGGTQSLNVKGDVATPADMLVTGNNVYYMRNAVVSWGTTGSSSAYMATTAVIEDCRKLSGRKATFSVYVRASAARTMALLIRRNNGYTSEVIGSKSVDVTTTWQRVSLTVDVSILQTSTGIGSLSATVIAYKNDNSAFAAPLGVIGATPAAGFYYDIASAQLEEGELGPYIYGSESVEFNRCLRFFEVVNVNIIGYVPGPGNNIWCATSWYPKRVLPTVAFNSGGTPQGVSAINILPQSPSGGGIYATSNSTGLVGGTGYQAQINAEIF